MAVTVDAEAEYNNFGSEANPADFTFTVGNHSDRLLLVWAWAGNEPDVTQWTATWDPTGTNQAMTVLYTQADQETYRGYRCWRLIAPTVGTLTLRIAMTSTYTLSVHVASVYTAHQTTPLGTVYVEEAAGGSQDSDVTVAVNTTDGLIYSFTLVGGSVTNLAASSPLTLVNIIGSSGTGTYMGGLARRVGTGSSLVTTWTWTEFQNVTAMSVDVKAAAEAGGTPLTAFVADQQV